MGPIWGRQDPGGPHVGPMNFAMWDGMIIFVESTKSSFIYFSQLFLCLILWPLHKIALNSKAATLWSIPWYLNCSVGWVHFHFMAARMQESSRFWKAAAFTNKWSMMNIINEESWQVFEEHVAYNAFHMSWHRNTSYMISPLWGESTVHQWIPN